VDRQRLSRSQRRSEDEFGNAQGRGVKGKSRKKGERVEREKNFWGELSKPSTNSVDGKRSSNSSIVRVKKYKGEKGDLG